MAYYILYSLPNPYSSLDGCLYANMIDMNTSEKSTVRLPLNLEPGTDVAYYLSFFFNISTEYGKLEVNANLCMLSQEK